MNKLSRRLKVKLTCKLTSLRWVEVGQASVVMAISSPHRHDGQQAIQHCISQLKANIPIWKKVTCLRLPTTRRSPCLIIDGVILIDRKSTTRRTRAGRRTPSVLGPFTISLIQSHRLQRTCDPNF